MGGGELARYVGKYGEDRLHSLVFAGAVPPYLLKTDDNPDGGLGEDDVAGMEKGVSADREDFLDGFTTGFFSADGVLKVTEEQRQQALALQAPARDEAVVGCIGAFGRTDFRNDLERVTVPTLVIHGDSDAIVPFEVSGKRTAETISGSTWSSSRTPRTASTSATPTSSTGPGRLPDLIGCAQPGAS